DVNCDRIQYLNHLVVQDILQSILHGQDIKLVENRIKNQNIELPFCFDQKIYLIKMNINRDFHFKMMQEYPTYIVTYYKIMKNLLQENGTFLLYDSGNHVFLWLLQITNRDVTSTQLVSIFKEFIDELCDQLNQSISIDFIQNELTFNELKNEYCNLKKDTIINPSPENSSSIIRIEEPCCYCTLQNQTEQIDITKLEHSIKKLESYLNLNDAQAFLSIIRSLQSQCNTITSMHDLRGIQCYLKISFILIQYIECHKIEYELSMKVGIYGLYYLNDYKSWKEAFDYLCIVSQHIFEIISYKGHSKNDLLIEKIKSYIEYHITTSITLTQIGKHLNYNESYLSRLFKQETGLNLFEYINIVRIEKSKDLLLQTNKSIQSIAWEIGFDTPQYFTGVFKKYVGMTPSNYRLREDHTI
ncbi:MAG: helix-turn-helix transcriptional regulator, partial [Eubacteriales bacterium]